MSEVTVLVPTFNGAALLRRFLPPLRRALAAAPVEATLFIVDNASTDDTRAYLEAEHPDAAVLSLARNEGFGRAVNAGLAEVQSPWVLCLNNDMHVEEDFLARLWPATAAPDLFAAVPRILLPTQGGQVESVTEGIWRDGFLEIHQPGLSVQGPSHPRSRAVLFGVAGCSLYHTERLRALGGFDEHFYPFYWEDVDVGYRAWRRGWRTVYVPESIVYHRHRGTIGAHVSPREVEAAMLRNQLLFHWKNLTRREDLERHFHALILRALEDEVRGGRGFLEGLLLALEAMEPILAARGAEPAEETGTPPVRREGGEGGTPQTKA